jgi:selenocysteine-specific elongation factor
MKRSELQSQTGLPQELLHAAVERLSATGKVQQTGDVIAIAGAASVNEQRETAKLDAVSSAYRTAGLAPSSVREVSQQLGIAEAELRGLITLLLRQRSLVRMGSDDVFVHAEALGRLSNQLAGFRGKSLDVGTFKALTGLTRKHAIPLLEYLDRERITRKQGDQRIVL